MRYWITKYYKIIASSFGLLINSIGLILSIIGTVYSFGDITSNRYITIMLIAAEAFLLASVIYTIFSVLKDYHSKDSIAEKDAELSQSRYANKTIFENQKATITYYKDFIDRLNLIVKQHLQRGNNTEKITEFLENPPEGASVPLDDLKEYLKKENERNVDALKNDLIEIYNRFIINVINLLRNSVEEYLSTKGCKTPVCIALKQLSEPTKYTEIDDRKNNIYTAFRDSQTYRSKVRNETWQKSFCIRKNSDFLVSIEKDYYIFNHMDKSYVDTGLYLNENQNFYENYNSGVTCTVYSCVGKERILYGFLACDSLIDSNSKKHIGRNIYDYNVANLMMSTAHTIALFLSEFLTIWDQYYIQHGCEKENVNEQCDAYKASRNLCQVMIESVKNTRYGG